MASGFLFLSHTLKATKLTLLPNFTCLLHKFYYTSTYVIFNLRPVTVTTLRAFCECSAAAIHVVRRPPYKVFGGRHTRVRRPSNNIHNIIKAKTLEPKDFNLTP